MAAYRLTPRAQQDVADIWAATTRQWGIAQAERYIQDIRDSIERVAAAPGLARACDDIRPGYRKFPTGSHMLFLRWTTHGLEVVRILHGRMDFPRRL